MAVMELWRRRDLEGTVKTEYIDGNFFTQDSAGNLVGVKCYKDGAEVTLTGSVTGYCVLPSGETVSVAGTRSGNKASILVPQSALAYTGPLGITLKLIDGSTITTLMRIIVVVYQSKTDTVITPSSQIITDWANQISAALQEVEDASAAQDAKIADLKSALSDTVVRELPQQLNLSQTLSGQRGNVFDKSKAVDGYGVNYNNSSITANSGFCISYIPVLPGDVLTQSAVIGSNAWGNALCDENKTIKTIYQSKSSNNPYTIPDGIFWVICTITPAMKDTFAVTIDRPSNDNIKDIIDGLKNFDDTAYKQIPIADLTKQSTGVYIDSGGNEQEATLYRLSDYIPVVPGQAYRVAVGTNYYSARFGAFYDANKTFVSTCISTNTSGDAGAYTFVAPLGVSYVRLCYLSSNELQQKINAINPISIVTPEMFGAVGDGVTDDTFAIRKMFAAFKTGAVGTRVAVCLGSYKIHDTISVDTAYINIIGLDNRPYVYTFDADVSIPIFNITDCSVCFDSVSFRGIDNNWNQTRGQGCALTYNLQTESPTLNGNIDAHVTNCNFSLLGTGVKVIGQNLEIHKCLFSQCAIGIEILSQDTQYLTNLKGHVITDNRFHQLQTAISNTAALQGMDNRSIIVAENMADIIFRFYNGFGTGLVMRNNYISYCVSGNTSFVLLNDEGLESPLPCLIIGNYFDANASNRANPGCKSCIDARTLCKITSNMFISSVQDAVVLSAKANRSMVSDNMFHDCGGESYYAINLGTANNEYFVFNNVTDNSNGENGIGGDALETSHLSNNFA